jgi:hypothetical protein
MYIRETKTEREYDCISGSVLGDYGDAGEGKRMLESKNC